MPAILCIAACTALNPAFDPPTAGPSFEPTNDEDTAADSSGGVSSAEPTVVSPTSSDAGESSSPSPSSGDDTTAGTTLESVETGSDGTAAEGGPTADDTGDGTDVLCPSCGECETCVAGACVPAAGGPCSQPVGLACEVKLWGLDLGTGDCLAYQAEAPVCVAPGVCDYPCAAPGNVVVDCHEGCVLMNHGCGQGTPVAAVSPSNVCITDYSMTSGCFSQCVYEQGFPNYELHNCDPQGQCTATNVFDCQYNTCSDAGGCSLQCESDMGCTPPAVCNQMTKMCVLI